MDPDSSQRIARAIPAGRGGRRVLFLFAGAAAALVAGAGWSAAPAAGSLAAAPRRSRPKRCRPGQRIGQVRVAATGAMAFTPKLKRGQLYTLIATGTVSACPIFFMDSYSFVERRPPFAPVKVYQGVRVGLSLDSASPEYWGLFNPRITLRGNNRRMSLQAIDPAPADNSGEFVVNVYCGGEGGLP